ncbi:MAG: serine hydrolase domain-containing protein [Xanthobacteraceae bacterium]
MASATIALTPAWADCDQDLVQQIAVQGLDSKSLNFPASSMTIPAFGFATPDMASAIDPLVGNFMNQFGAPGGVITITYNNHLIFAKSYGWADVGNTLFVQPDSRLRIASITKAITAMGVLKLVHDETITPPLPHQVPPQPLQSQPFVAGFGHTFGPVQSWIKPATVDQLLHHEGGWGEDYESWTTLQAVEAAQKASGMSVSVPPDCLTLLGYVQTQPMTPQDFKPGQGQQYSNIGFCALGQFLRKASGASSYFAYIQSNVLKPLGMNDTLLGSSQQSGQLDREVVYYPCGYIPGVTPPVNVPGVPLIASNCHYQDANGNYEVPPIQGTSLFAPFDTVSAAYGGGLNANSLQASEGAGGLVSTAIDLARFSGAIASAQLPNFPDAPRPIPLPGKPPILPPPVWPQKFYTYTTAITPYEQSRGITNSYFGMGWDAVQPNPVATPLVSYNNFNLMKSGGFPGTVSGVVTTGDGYSFAALFNGDRGNDTDAPYKDIFWIQPNGGGGLAAAYAHAKAQPWNIDFFPQYSQDYSKWMVEPAFGQYLKNQGKQGFYPSRLEARAKTLASGQPYLEYRVRLGPQQATAGSTPPNYMYGQSCATVLSAIQSAPPSTPLVSLQKVLPAKPLIGPFPPAPQPQYVYQAVWSAPIPQLP